MDRSRRGGGIVIYVKDQFICSIIETPNLNLELLWLSVKCWDFSFVVGTFYHPPNSDSTVLDALSCSISNLGPKALKNLFLVGDFNIDFLSVDSSEYQYLSDLMSSYSLTQCVSEPTQVVESSSTLIDLCLVSLVNSCCVLPPLARLIILFCLYRLLYLLGLSLRGLPKRNVPFGFIGMLTLIWQMSYFHILIGMKFSSMDDIEISWARWKSIFLDIMSLCIPTCKSSSYRLPWISKAIIVEMKKRDFLYRQFRRT